MAAKTTVYIPDDLYEEVQKLEGVNVSGLLQDALRREVELRKRVSDPNDPDVLEVARKLDAERTQALSERFPAAYKLGRSSAKSFEGEDLAQIAEHFTDYVEGEEVGHLSRHTLTQFLGSLDDRLDRPFFEDNGLTRAAHVAAFMAGIADVYRAATEE